MEFRTYMIAMAAPFASACADPQGVGQTPDAPDAEAAASHQQIKTGNGERNYIVLDGASRNGAVFTFREVSIDAPGWLVIHPFRDGVPVQTEYVGATLLAEGKTADAQITVDPAPETGEMMIVMLHYDMNRDGVFDFNDGVTVPDAPVFEDGVLIALRYQAP